MATLLYFEYMYVKVRVTAGAKKEKSIRLSESLFEIQVKERAERNMANRRVQGILAGEFTVPPRSVRLISGHRSPVKVFSIDV